MYLIRNFTRVSHNICKTSVNDDQHDSSERVNVARGIRGIDLTVDSRCRINIYYRVEVARSVDSRRRSGI